MKPDQLRGKILAVGRKRNGLGSDQKNKYAIVNVNGQLAKNVTQLPYKE